MIASSADGNNIRPGKYIALILIIITYYNYRTISLQSDGVEPPGTNSHDIRPGRYIALTLLITTNNNYRTISF